MTKQERQEAQNTVAMLKCAGHNCTAASLEHALTTLSLPSAPAPLSIGCPLCACTDVREESVAEWFCQRCRTVWHKDWDFFRAPCPECAANVALREAAEDHAVIAEAKLDAWNRRAPCPECAKLTAERDRWIEDTRQRAVNVEYWTTRSNAAEAKLANAIGGRDECERQYRAKVAELIAMTAKRDAARDSCDALVKCNEKALVVLRKWPGFLFTVGTVGEIIEHAMAILEGRDD